MALKKKSWVWQTTTTAGVGALTLAAGAASHHRTFSAAGFVDGDTAVVTFHGQTSGQKETHVSTINISGPTTTVTRNTLIASTTGSIISWSGTETVDVYLAAVPERTRTNDEPIDLQDRVDVASAGTCAIYSANSNYIRITGTTTITSFGSPTTTTGLTSMYRKVVAGGVFLLTHGASLILPAAGSNITTAAGDAFLVVYEGAGVSRVLYYQRADGTMLTTTVLSTPGWTRSARTSNTVLGTADKRTFIDITSGTFTQTFSACATLGSDWVCEIRNSGTGDITLDPSGSETIDGLTSFIMYPGEARRVYCSGTALYSVVLSGFSKKYTGGATFTKPPGYQRIIAEAQGAGGGGGSGCRHALSTSDKPGGGGGGGGGRGIRDMAASIVGTTETITVGLGGAGGTAVTTNGTDGNSGIAGGDSSFGSLIVGKGGSAGAGGEIGSFGNGGAGGSAGGAETAIVATAGIDFRGAGASNSSALDGLRAYYGGGSGGKSHPTSGVASGGGGSSLRGAAGGGAGGGDTSANNLTVAVPGAGGKSLSATTGGGGTAGTNSAAAPVAGGAATAGGMGGGGGGASQSIAAAAGGAGQDGGGGGGGGCSANGYASGAGGRGGDGSVLVVGVV